MQFMQLMFYWAITQRFAVNKGSIAAATFNSIGCMHMQHLNYHAVARLRLTYGMFT